jgi:hypothetical protein
MASVEPCVCLSTWNETADGDVSGDGPRVRPRAELELTILLYSTHAFVDRYRYAPPGGRRVVFGATDDAGTFDQVVDVVEISADTGSVQLHCVGLSMLDDINDQQLERFAPDASNCLPLPHRLQNEIPGFVGDGLAGFYVVDLQIPRKDIYVSRIGMVVRP